MNLLELANKYKTYTSLTEDEKVELQELLIELTKRYEFGDPVISDEAYDNLQELAVYEGATRLTGIVSGKGNKIQHPIQGLRGSLDKIYYLEDIEKNNNHRKSLDDWIRTREFDIDDPTVQVACKFDGLSCVGYFRDGQDDLFLTRGDTTNNEGLDITSVMKAIPIDKLNKEKFRNCAIQYELMMTLEDLQSYNQNYGTAYKNTRSGAASAIYRTSIDDRVKYITPVPLKIIFDGEDIPSIHPRLKRDYPTITCKLSDVLKIREFSNEHKVWNGLRMDGSVITILDTNLQKKLGRKHNLNMYEVAYKFTEETAYTQVHDIRFDVSALGRITPVVKFDPIILKGNTVTCASMFNIDRFNEFNLKRGDYVKIEYDIIPVLRVDKFCKDKNKSNTGSKIPFIKYCPSCGELLTIDGASIYCDNMNCDNKKKGRIINYLKKLGVDYFGEATVNDLVDAGVLSTIPSLYHIGSTKQYRMISKLNGFGELKTKNILLQIKKISTLKDYQFFAAINSHGLGKRTFQAIFNKYQFTEFIEQVKDKQWKEIQTRVIDIGGIGPEKSELLIKSLKDDRKLITQCLKYVTIQNTFEDSDNIKGICFTKIRDHEYEKVLESKGYTIQDNVNKYTTILVVPSLSESSGKINKAIKSGIKIITLDDLKNQIGQ
jgi:DNA ligase (NAD+)